MVWRYVWRLARDIVGAGQIMGSKGHHVNKLQITYKKEEDRFHMDAISNGGYTYLFYFRNHPAPKKYLGMGFLLLRARVMTLFGCLSNKFYQARFDNLCMAARFGLNFFRHGKQVLVEDVCKTDSCGLPSGVFQAEVSGENRANAVNQGHSESGSAPEFLASGNLPPCHCVGLLMIPPRRIFCSCVERKLNESKTRRTRPTVAPGLEASCACT